MERRTPLVSLDRDQIQAYVTAALPGAQVLDHSLLAGGRANTNYLVGLAKPHGQAVLRLYVRAPSACAKEVALARAVPAGVPMAPLLGWAPQGEPHPGALFGFVPGQTLADWILQDVDVLPAGRALGRVLGSLSGLEFALSGDLCSADGETLTVKEWGLGDDAALGFGRHCLFESPAGERLGRVLRDRLWAYLQHGAQRWGGDHPQTHLAHGDFNPTNLLLEREGGAWVVRAVLDWEFAHAGGLHGDLGNLLRDRPESPLPRGFAEEVRAGVAEAGLALAPDWQTQARYVDLLSACEFLSSEATRPRVHARAKAQVAATLAKDAPAAGGQT